MNYELDILNVLHIILDMLYMLYVLYVLFVLDGLKARLKVTCRLQTISRQLWAQKAKTGIGLKNERDGYKRSIRVLTSALPVLNGSAKYKVH